MTENQFKFDRDTVATNLKTPIVYDEERMSIGEVLDKLNELSDENEQLKQGLNDDLELIGQLQEENEQLKKENYELHKRLGDFEPFEDHIKERTSKTSVNDIIGLVKTDEPTDIVELEKELKE